MATQRLSLKGGGDSLSGSLNRNASGTLRKTGEVALGGSTGASFGGASGSPTAGDDASAVPHIPRHLSTSSLTRRRKLASSTGNHHGYMAEDYSRLNWPLPKMFGYEKYGYTLIDIEDTRYVKECAAMSKKLIRLSYDLQIVDLEWRKTYKALLDAEHRQATLPPNCQEKTKAILKKEVDGCMKYLLELQEQKDLYEQNVKEVYARCDHIKETIKKENDLEDLRVTMENKTKERTKPDSDFWTKKFEFRSSVNQRRASIDIP